jgi:cyanophycin synthetase
VITQISDHQLGVDDKRSLDLVRLNAVVANSAGPCGHVVLNADDEGCVEIGSRLCGRAAYYSVRAGSPVVEKHVREGGRAVVLQTGEGVFLVDGRETALLLENDILAPNDERDSSSIASALASAAACVALQINVEHIREGLRSFEEDSSPRPR